MIGCSLLLYGLLEHLSVGQLHQTKKNHSSLGGSMNQVCTNYSYLALDVICTTVISGRVLQGSSTARHSTGMKALVSKASFKQLLLLLEKSKLRNARSYGLQYESGGLNTLL